jgi:hypothetical protein
VSEAPVIIYVPGLLPKPEAEVHRDALLRCLLFGLQQVDTDLAVQLESNTDSFEIIPWTYDFYGEHRDFALDAPSVEALLKQRAATSLDQYEASSLRRRLARWVFLMGDRLPFLIPHIATERMEMHLRDLKRYVNNRNEVAEHTRQILKTSLREARDSGRPILLMAHSMGSVIAYESLWQMSRANREPMQIDLLLTMGSPLGQDYIQKRLKGSDAIGNVRYPDNISNWVNLSAVGDLTAIKPALGIAFREMVQAGLLSDIDDRLVDNWFRLDGVLNTHSEYGYLANSETAAIVSNWWRSVSPGPDSAESRYRYDDCAADLIPFRCWQ